MLTYLVENNLVTLWGERGYNPLNPEKGESIMAWYAFEVDDDNPWTPTNLFDVISRMENRKDFDVVYLRVGTPARMYCFSSELPSIIEEFREFTSMKIIEKPSNLEEFQKIKV
jgi:hypothetical protein